MYVWCMMYDVKVIIVIIYDVWYMMYDVSFKNEDDLKNENEPKHKDEHTHTHTFSLCKYPLCILWSLMQIGRQPAKDLLSPGI